MEAATFLHVRLYDSWHTILRSWCVRFSAIVKDHAVLTAECSAIELLRITCFLDAAFGVLDASEFL